MHCQNFLCIKMLLLQNEKCHYKECCSFKYSHFGLHTQSATLLLLSHSKHVMFRFYTTVFVTLFKHLKFFFFISLSLIITLSFAARYSPKSKYCMFSEWFVSLHRTLLCFLWVSSARSLFTSSLSGESIWF